MSTTYGLDVNELDRRQRALDRDRHSAEFSIGTTGEGRAVGSPVQHNQKLVGCECFGYSPDNAASFRAIHALQLIPNFDLRYRSYELNLVMSDGKRLHVVVYADRSPNKLREDVTILSRFLGKPVWDALCLLASGRSDPGDSKLPRG